MYADVISMQKNRKRKKDLENYLNSNQLFYVHFLESCYRSHFIYQYFLDINMAEENKLKPKPLQPLNVQIKEALQELGDAMLENIEANKAVVDAQLRKKKAHNRQIMAKDFLYRLERELNELGDTTETMVKLEESKKS